MRPVRIALSIAALALLGMLALWWLADSQTAVESAVRTTSEPVAERSSESSTEFAAPEAAPKAPPLASRELVALQAEIPPATPAPPDLHGSVVIVEADGTESTLVTGSLALTTWASVTPRHEQVNVVHGAWTVPGELLRGATALSFRSLQLGVQGTAIDAPIGLVLRPWGDEIVVRARPLSSASLRVLAADSGLELQHVTLLSTESFGGEERHPGLGYEPRILARDLRSPIYLEEPLFPRRRYGKSKTANILVGAPRYAWAHAEIALAAGGEHVVALEPGADLAVDVFGCSSGLRAFLRLRRSADFEEPYVQMALRKDGRFVLNGLPAGEYRIAAEVEDESADFGSRPRLLGMVAVQLRAGELTEARLELGSTPSRALVAASGTVFVPKSWRVSQLRLALTLLDAPLEGFETTRVLSSVPATSQRNGFDAFTWSQDQLQVGSYLLRSEDPADATVVDVPAGGRAGLEWIVGPPAELVVHVVDDGSGAPMDADHVWWRVSERQRFVGGLAQREAAGVYRLHAPVGVIELYARQASYEDSEETVDLEAGAREVTLRLKRAQGFTLRLMDGAFPFASDDPLPGFAAGEGHAGEVVDFERTESGWKYMVSEPGTYRLRMGIIDGYKPVPDQLIEVFAGSFTGHVIALERAD